jgi:hypothetical protein
MGIYDIFKMAAAGAEKVPWRWRLLAGAGGGAAVGAMSGDKDTPVMERMAKGAFIGTGIGLGAGIALRGAGGLASGAESIGKTALSSKTSAIGKAMRGVGSATRQAIHDVGPLTSGEQGFMGIISGRVRQAGEILTPLAKGLAPLTNPGTLALGGAAIGAMVAPSGHRMKSAAVGAGVGFAAMPAMQMMKGWKALGNVYGGQTTALIAAAAVPVAASAMFGKATPDGSANAAFGAGGITDYSPSSDDMRDRMYAMNASGDLVLGLHGRQHGG